MTTNQGKRYSEDFKKSIVTLHHNGKSINQLSKEYNITHAAITKWVVDGKRKMYKSWK